MAKRYIVNLTAAERQSLEAMVRSKASVQKRQRAQILLKADEDWTDSEIADELGVGLRTVERVRERCCVEGLEAAIEPRPRAQPPRSRKLDGAAEAKLVQLACCE